MILSILKIIGIVLLVILALLIFILGVLLLVPIHYQFAGEYKENPKADILVKWSPLLLKVTVRYHNDKLEYIVKLLGGVVMTNMDIPLSWIGRRFFSSDEEPDEMEYEKTEVALREPSVSPSTAKVREIAVSPSVAKDSKHPEPVIKQKKKQSAWKKIRNTIQNSKKKVKQFINQLKRLNEKKEALLRVYHSKRFEVAKKDVTAYIKTLWGIMRPKHLEGFVHFGLEDPASTGQVLGILAMFLMWYDRYLQIQPDFEQACLDGYLNGKGQFQLFPIVKLLIKIIFNKNLIKVIKKVQTIIEA